MQHIALARKWRPQNFTQVTGQEVVVKALSHALDTNRLHHAYLFTGTRGVGKTTLSRLLAKAFSCEVGVSSNPCGVCNNCVAIQNNQYIDYIELDAASNRGVEEISKVLDNASYQPSQGRYKVFMIDEVHMLSNHAFNAMLKTLEEPPPHVKFILATTDAHKIPMTVLSRCLQFHLRAMSNTHIIDYLQIVLNAEQIQYDIPALNYIAKAAKGSMRDALSITDQSIALGHGKIDIHETKAMLGMADEDMPLFILICIAQNRLQDALNQVEAIQNIDGFIDQFIVCLQNIAIIQAIPQADIDTINVGDVRFLAQNIHAENIQIYYQMALNTKQELSFVPPEIALNMLLLRMLHFRIQPIKDYTNIAINNSVTPAISAITDKPTFTSPATTTIINKNIDKKEVNQIIIPSETESASESETKNIKTNAVIENTRITSSPINIDINLNSNTIFNHDTWLHIIPMLNLEGLCLQIAKQSIVQRYEYTNNIHIIYLTCAFDTSFMKNAMQKLELALAQHFMAHTPENKINTSVLLHIKNELNEQASMPAHKLAIQKIDAIEPEPEPKTEIEKTPIQNLAPMTLSEQEQKQQDAYNKDTMLKIQQDAWVQAFVNIGAKINLN
jgi:DNA polymerase III subunit gamma/tau